MRAGVNAGFDRVWWTIVDTHVSSLIAALFLLQFGTGPIRGFADDADHRAALERVHRGVRLAHGVRARAVAPPAARRR